MAVRTSNLTVPKNGRPPGVLPLGHRTITSTRSQDIRFMLFGCLAFPGERTRTYYSRTCWGSWPKHHPFWVIHHWYLFIYAHVSHSHKDPFNDQHTWLGMVGSLGPLRTDLLFQAGWFPAKSHDYTMPQSLFFPKMICQKWVLKSKNHRKMRLATNGLLAMGIHKNHLRWCSNLKTCDRRRGKHIGTVYTGRYVLCCCHFQVCCFS